MAYINEPTPLQNIDSMSDLGRDLRRLHELKQQKSAIEDEITFLNIEIAKELTGPVELTAPNGDKLRASYVSSETFDVDLTTLARLDLDLFNRVTKQVLDSTAFKKAVTGGELAPDIAAVVVNIKPRAGFVKLTHVKEETNE